MSNNGFSVVTGAFGYTGRYIARRLLDEGATVRTLTRAAASTSPFTDRVDRRPRNFDNVAELTESLRGAHTLYNTYWVRFARGPLNHETAVRNTRNLVMPPSPPVLSALSTSASPAQMPHHPFPTSAARALSKTTSVLPACLGPSSGPP